MFNTVSQKFTLVLGLLLSLVLFGFPLSFGIGNVAGLPITTHNYSFRALLLLLAISVLILRGAPSRLLSGTPAWLWWTFWAIYTLKFGEMLLDSEINYVGSMSERYGFIYWGGVNFLPALLILAIPSDDKDLIAASKCSTFIIIAGCAFTYASVIYIVGMGDVNRFRVDETLNPITFGHLGVSAMLLALCGTGFTSRMLDMALRLGLCAAGIYAVYASSSRGPLAALGICLLFYLVFSRSIIARARLVMLAVPALLFYLWISLMLDELGSSFRSRVIENFSEDSGRLLLWSEAMVSFLQNPFWGNKISMPDGSYPHNVIIESFYVTGVAGGLLFTSLCIWVLVRSARLVRDGGSRAILGMIFVQYFVMNMFSGSIWGSSPFFAAMSAVIAFSGSQVSALSTKHPN